MVVSVEESSLMRIKERPYEPAKFCDLSPSNHWQCWQVQCHRGLLQIITATLFQDGSGWVCLGEKVYYPPSKSVQFS